MAFEFLVLVSRQLGVTHRRHLDMNVDAVEQRAGNTHPVALQLLCRTLADMLWVVGKATHASVGIGVVRAGLDHGVGHPIIIRLKSKYLKSIGLR